VLADMENSTAYTYSATTPAPAMRELNYTRVREVYRACLGRVEDGLQPLSANLESRRMNAVEKGRSVYT
jgi:hypothetical protein